MGTQKTHIIWDDGNRLNLVRTIVLKEKDDGSKDLYIEFGHKIEHTKLKISYHNSGRRHMNIDYDEIDVKELSKTYDCPVNDIQSPHMIDSPHILLVDIYKEYKKQIKKDDICIKSQPYSVFYNINVLFNV